MTDDRLPHRLTVVWFTDLVGYSSLTAQDEDRAIALVRRFQAAVRAAVPSDAGRIVKFIGDAALVESSSAESALSRRRCCGSRWGKERRCGLESTWATWRWPRTAISTATA